MADVLNETLQELAKNETTKPKATTEGMMVAYTSLVLMACLPIFFGAFRSISCLQKQKDSGQKAETMSKKDAAMFPLIASCALVSLYIFFKLFSKEYINLLVTVYFFGLGVLSLTHLLSPFVNKFVPENYQVHHHLVYTKGSEGKKSENIPKIESFLNQLNVMGKLMNSNFLCEEIINFTFGTADVIALVICSMVGGVYIWNKHWIVNNIFGIAFAVNGVEFLHLNNIIIGCMLLGGLFIYDIFWVFATDVMVTVAKSFEAPIKLVFPQDLLENWLNGSNFAMLGLGDIVIPGIFIAFLLRFDLRPPLERLPPPWRAISPRPISLACRLQQNTSGAENVSTPNISLNPYENFPKILRLKRGQKLYFYSSFIAYFLGLVLTIVIMSIFKHAQPALLYLVPACIGIPGVVALIKGDVNALLKYHDHPEESESKDQTANSAAGDSSNSPVTTSSSAHNKSD